MTPMQLTLEDEAIIKAHNLDRAAFIAMRAAELRSGGGPQLPTRKAAAATKATTTIFAEGVSSEKRARILAQVRAAQARHGEHQCSGNCAVPGTCQCAGRCLRLAP
jgi:hypothetical protein